MSEFDNLIKAVEANDVNKVAEMLKKKPSLLIAPSESQYPPLHK